MLHTAMRILAEKSGVSVDVEMQKTAAKFPSIVRTLFFIYINLAIRITI
jgi:hypothetical protein